MPEPADLDDVIGLDAAKREVAALAARLATPSEHVPVPRGVLLWGPPGCGKTLLARVLTNLLGGEGPAPMYAFGATELLERDAFARIAAHFEAHPARAAVFVDELDLVGRARDDYRHTNASRRALYAALDVLDGLRRRDGVVWLFATSTAPHVLDEALLRPGRIDVRIEVGYPDRAEREYLLTRLASRVFVVGELDLARAAAMLGHRKSPAAINAVVQDALGLALADGTTGLDWAHLAEAIRRDGNVADDDESDEVRRRTAVHEAGHAIVARLLGQPLTNVTIEARHGRTDLDEAKPNRLSHTDAFLGRVTTVRLAGLAAERLLFGEPAIGAEADIASATMTALRRLDAGLDADFGPIAWRRTESRAAADEAFTRVRGYLRARFAEAERLVGAHESAVRRFAVLLLAERQLSGDRLDAALADALAEPATTPNGVSPTVIASEYAAVIPTRGEEQ